MSTFISPVRNSEDMKALVFVLERGCNYKIRHGIIINETFKLKSNWITLAMSLKNVCCFVHKSKNNISQVKHKHNEDFGCKTKLAHL